MDTKLFVIQIFENYSTPLLGAENYVYFWCLVFGGEGRQDVGGFYKYP